MKALALLLLSGSALAAPLPPDVVLPFLGESATFVSTYVVASAGGPLAVTVTGSNYRAARLTYTGTVSAISVTDTAGNAVCAPTKATSYTLGYHLPYDVWSCSTASVPAGSYTITIDGAVSFAAASRYAQPYAYFSVEAVTP